MKQNPATKRFRSLKTLRAFVSKRLRELEETLAEDKANFEAHRTATAWARLMSDLITRGDVEDRLKKLEKAERLLSPAPADQSVTQ